MITRIGIITPVFNQHFYTLKFLESLEKQKLKNISIVAVIVDNGSDELASVALVKYAEFVHFIRNEENLGFAPACNQGIKYLMDNDLVDAYVITNNDMELDESCIQELYNASSLYPNAGVIGGKLRFPDGIIQHAGAFLGAYGWGQHKHSGIPDSFLTQSYSIEEYVTGALFFVKKDVMDKLKGFDEKFSPAYFEEVAFCYSVRNLGYDVLYCPYAKGIHYENVTGKKIYNDVNSLKRQLSDTNQVKFYQDRDNDFYTPTSEYQLLISSKIYGNWSFSSVMRNLAKGLNRNGVDVSIAPQEYHEDSQSMPDWEIKEMILKPNDYWNRVVLRSSEGDQMYLMPPGKKRIAHTTGESSIINNKWKEQLNNTDLVLTTSNFFKTVMVEGGVVTPIKVLHNSFDPEIYNNTIDPLPLDNLRGMNFCSVFHYGNRKSPETLIKAFGEEFNPSDDVTLFIHSLSIEHVIQRQGMNIQQWVNKLLNGKSHAPILITSNYVDDRVLAKILRNFQVFVMPTKGEGFGLPVLETSALGIPSIVTNYSGVLDIVDTKTGFLLDYKLEDIPLQYLPYFKNYIGGKWAIPSLSHLRQLMRYCYDYPEVVKEKGNNAFKKAQNFTINEIGNQAKEIIFG